MQLTLSPELAEVIEELVKSGGYHDTEEVVAEAVFALRQQRQLEALHAAIAIGEQDLARGDVELYTPELFEEIQRSAMKKAREGHMPDPDVCP